MADEDKTENQDDAVRQDPTYLAALDALEAGAQPDDVISGKTEPPAKAADPAETATPEGGEQKEPAPASEETKDGEPEGAESAAEDDKKEPQPGDQRLATLEQKLEKTEKALKDTQRWGHEQSGERSRLQKEIKDLKRRIDAQEHKDKRPDILEREPELEDAIRHVAGGPGKPTGEDDGPYPAQDEWKRQIATVHPDIDDLFQNEVVRDYLKGAAAHYGDDWRDPLVVIREVNVVKDKLAEARAVHARRMAVEDHQRKAKQNEALRVPGTAGSGGNPASKTEEEQAKSWATMPDEDFDKAKEKLAYSAFR